MALIRAFLTAVTGDEPVSYEEMVAHLRVDDNFAEEDLIRAQISAARDYAERVQGRALVAGTYSGFMDSRCRGTFPLSGTIAVSAVNLVPDTGAETVVPSGTYYVDASGEPPTFVPTDPWPTGVTIRDRGGIRLTFTVTPFPVNERVKAAIKLMAADLYEHREDTLAGTSTARLSHGARHLLGIDRIWTP